MKPPESKRCVSCGHELSGQYCSSCGEKVVNLEEHTLRHFFMQVLNAFTFADTRAWKSLKLLFTRPGKLPREYLEGRRKPYISPLSLFFLINFLYFLVAPFDTFNTHFQSQMNGQVYSKLIHDFAHNELEESQLDQTVFEARYNSHSANLSKSILLLMALLFAVPLMLMFFSKTSLYIEHLMFSLSFVSFLLLGTFILLPYLIFAAQSLLNWVGFDFHINWNGLGSILFALSIIGVYLGKGLKTFYNQPYTVIVPKTLVLIFALVFTVLFYRFALFFATIWTM